MSSDRSVSVPVEASIEDLHDSQYEASGGSVQADAKAGSSPSALEEKLDQELHYHKHGSYSCNSDAAYCLHRSSSNPLLPNISTSDHAIRQPEQDRPSCVSSVHSWTKAEPVQPTSQEEALYHPASCHYPSMNSSTPTPSHLPMSASTPSLPQFNQQHPHSHYDRQQSWPIYPVSDTSAPDTSHGRLLAPSKNSLPQDAGAHRDTSVDSRARCLTVLLPLTDMYRRDCAHVCLLWALSRISIHPQCQRDPDREQQHDEHQRLRVPPQFIVSTWLS